MDYYKLLNFTKEPFSNSPDPGLFYNSRQHLEVLQKLEIAIRLKRGVNVVIGDIGTGKTTLSRQLIQEISNDDSIKFHVILDPGFTTRESFLKYLLNLFLPEKKYETADDNTLKEIIKEYLFLYGVDNNINTVIIIDEGQKLSLECIEVLRELLNFETNDQKLLQIVIFAQKEFEDSLNQVGNFKDRINFFYRFNPLNFKETKALITHRLDKCVIKGKSICSFTLLGYYLIYRATKGFPRKIINLCHTIILSLITENKSKAGFLLVRSCVSKVFPKKETRRPVLVPLIFLMIFLSGIFLGQYSKYDQDKSFPISFQKPAAIETITIQKPVEIKTVSLPIIKKIPISVTDLKPAEIKKIEPIMQIDPFIPIKKTFVKKEKPNQKILRAKPEVYGSIGVPENSTLINMIIIVYGAYKGPYLEKVLKANPDIQCPDNIKAGMPIVFPVIKSEHIDANKIFIVISQSHGFEMAYETADRHKSSDLDVRILPVWNKNKGFLFPVVIDKPFFSINEADMYKKNLLDNIAAESKNISLMKGSEIKQKG